ncbi:hypothetical protein BOTBODRAFT_569187 [Botryobasidium botryosum FD-172 SS1]|uniref:Uncharacterized protein n=1 Tax=Botryobasidium botryosum (strain FD-172 SS1) TaxID=930990 RepID=A0A067LYN3_BOTB1|nr:hypothetical protein BOTBODRAFT_569187 [Botryobasidium botryosum FD-172 SS1]
MGCISRDYVRVDSLFRPGFRVESATTDSCGHPKNWSAKPYSDKRIFRSELYSNFKGRMISALITLIDLLLFSGISVEGDFRDPDGVTHIPFLGDRIYYGLKTPLNAVIYRVCYLERMIYEPVPGHLHCRDELTVQLDYAFRVFEALMNKGASCRPCKTRVPCSALPTSGSLRLACTSPWQCGPSSHSGRIFLLLLATGASLCPARCELATAAYGHSSWKVKQLLQHRAGVLEDDMGYVLFQAAERCAESTEEEQVQIHTIRQLAQAGAQHERKSAPINSGALPVGMRRGCVKLKMVEYCLIGLGAKISPSASGLGRDVDMLGGRS